MKWTRTLIAAVLALAMAAAVPLTTPRGAAAEPGPENPWLTDGSAANIAHGGGLHEAPQNTLFAFKTAASRGADVIEMDLQITADGQIVAMHDSTVDRTTSGQGCVVEHTLAEIQQLDAADTHVPGQGPVAGQEPGAYPYRGIATGEVPAPDGFAASDFTVPTLASIFEALPETRMVMEIKPEEVETVDGVEHDCPGALDAIPASQRPEITTELARLIDEHGMRDQVIVASFIDEMLGEFISVAPEVDTSFPLQEGLAFYQAFTQDTAPPNPHGHEVIQAPLEIAGIKASAEFVAFARDHGVAVHFWTINDRDQMETLLDWGADGIITDRPQVLAQVLDQDGTPPYVARFSDRTCGVLDHFVEAFGFEDVQAMIRNGVRGYGGVADEGDAHALEDPPANDGPCEVTVTWPAEDLPRVREIADAWGVSVDELANMGGVILPALVYIAAREQR